MLECTVGGQGSQSKAHNLLERCHGGKRWAHGHSAQGTQEWVRDTQTLDDR